MSLRYRPIFSSFIVVILASGILTPSANPARAAELKAYADVCENNVCFWHKTVASPPKGWIEDEAWTKRYKALVMFPNGERSRTKPVMYVRTHPGETALQLEDYVNVAQQRWKARLPDSKIEPQPEIKREGKPGFKVFLYKNPSQPGQAFELTAFTKDVDAAKPDQTYFFQIVLSSPSMKELEKAKPAFYALLRGL